MLNMMYLNLYCNDNNASNEPDNVHYEKADTNNYDDGDKDDDNDNNDDADAADDGGGSGGDICDNKLILNLPFYLLY